MSIAVYPPLEFRLYQVKDRMPEAGTKVDVWINGRKGQEIATVKHSSKYGLPKVIWCIASLNIEEEAYGSDYWRPNRTEFFAQLPPTGGQTLLNAHE